MAAGKKMMEIIGYKLDPKEANVKLDLLDTSFSQLSRKIGDDPGADWETISEGDKLSKQVLTTLNTEQLSYKTRFENFKTQYNSYISSVSGKVALTYLDYNFSSLKDYSSKYIPGKTVADYFLMTEFVNAEKEIYESGRFWTEENFKLNQEKLKQWSKTKPYGSCVGIARSIEFEMKHTGSWAITAAPGYGVGVKTYGGSRHDKQRIEFYNIQNLPLGATATATMKGTYTRTEPVGSGDREVTTTYTAYAAWSVTKTLLGMAFDDGRIVLNGSSWSGDGADRKNGTAYIVGYTGDYSPHFNTNNLNLLWFKSRVLI